MSLDRDKGRTNLFGLNFESFVEIRDEEFFQESIGLLFCFDAVQAEFIQESALKSSIDPFAPASGFRRISGDRPDAQLREGAAYLSQMSFQDLASSFGSKEEMAGPVRIQGAEDPLVCDTIFEKLHATHCAFLLNQFHLIDFTRGVIHQNKQIKENPGKGWDPLMGAAVKVKHHADERFTRPPSPVFSSGLGSFNKPRRLKGAFDEGVAAGNVVMLL